MLSLKIAMNRNTLVPNENASNSSNCSSTCRTGTVIFSTCLSRVLPVRNSGGAPNAGSQALRAAARCWSAFGTGSSPRLRRARAGAPQASPVRAQPRPAVPPADNAPVLLGTGGRMGPSAARNLRTCLHADICSRNAPLRARAKQAPACTGS